VAVASRGEPGLAGASLASPSQPSPARPVLCVHVP